MKSFLVLACSACYGQSDSAMAKGMNFGIFTLMAIMSTVLIGFFVFMVYLIKKSQKGL